VVIQVGVIREVRDALIVQGDNGIQFRAQGFHRINGNPCEPVGRHLLSFNEVGKRDAIQRGFRAIAVSTSSQREAHHNSNGGIWTEDNVRHQIQNIAIVDRLGEKLEEIPEGSMQYEVVAQSLNGEGTPHVSGGPWNAEKVETAIKRKLNVSVLCARR
jgi:hypothetical protein